MPNRLINETSPYLLQHADNPVDWYPWCEEALQRARAEDKPILLSIGYSACHWCHVMEHESFEDPEIARIMNELFINIKVDREERPDLDSIYMNAVQAMTGHGGWPMTVFLTPDGAPFYAGTYFPPEDRGGMPGFKRVLQAVAEAYRTQRERVVQHAQQIREHLAASQATRALGILDAEILNEAYDHLRDTFDREYGGFGGAPKFPQPMTLEFLLRTYHRTSDVEARQMVEFTLQQMARGGMYDQIGGGFHRYAVDRQWLVPHFEKMLYDNALLSRVYLETYQATGNPFYRTIAEQTLDYVIREMRSPEGGFYSTQDADSEGEEGKFYLWTRAEMREVLGEEADIVIAYYGVTEQGNFEGKNILSVSHPFEYFARSLGMTVPAFSGLIERSRMKLYQARSKRVWPGRDEKILTAWNGLMLRSFALAATVLKRQAYRRVAVENADFLLSKLVQDGHVLRSYKDGQARLNGYLEDYANLIDGLVSLYETTFDLRWFRAALTLAERMVEQFWDPAGERFFDTGRDHEQLFVRPREITDNATPAGNSVATDVLLRLAILSGREEFRRIATSVLASLGGALARFPSAFGRLLGALDFHLSQVREIAIIGSPDSPETQALLDVVWQRYLPNKVVAGMRPGDDEAPRLVPLLIDRASLDGRSTAYVCENYTCQLPVTAPQALVEQLSTHPEPSSA